MVHRLSFVRFILSLPEITYAAATRYTSLFSCQRSRFHLIACFLKMCAFFSVPTPSGSAFYLRYKALTFYALSYHHYQNCHAVLIVSHQTLVERLRGRGRRRRLRRPSRFRPLAVRASAEGERPRQTSASTG